MRKLFISAAIGLSAFMLTGCADTDIDVFEVEKPQSIADYEYLDTYGNLKDYIDRSAHPTFKLGSGVSAYDYIKKGMLYRLSNNNFDILTAGNAMKYASIVNEKGEMDFGTVYSFVDAAREAGIEIYGHTLCWHAQQQVKYLNSLIADRDLPPVAGVGKCMYVNANNKGANPWDQQIFYDLKTPMAAGVNYTLKYRSKASSDVVFPFWIETPGAGNTHYGIPQFNAGKSWGDYSISFTPGSECSRLLFNFGQFGGEMWWDDFVLTAEGSDENLIANGGFEVNDLEGWQKPGWHSLTFSIIDAPGDSETKIYIPLLSGGDGESGECPNLISRVPGAEDSPAKVVDDPLGTGKVFEAPYNANPATAWDSQFFIKSNTVLQEGDKVRVSFRYRTTDARNIDTQAHGNPGAYHHYEFIGTLNATTQWKEHTWTGTITGTQAGNEGCISIAFNIASKSDAGSFYIDDVTFEIEKSANTLPLTPEEKAEVLEAEMERWIKGMMEATGGYVKCWDVVNEAISGGPGGQRYDLQHASNGSNNDFFWQDYLGDNFVRIPVKYARQYFEEFGGNAEDLKLFINDYNLESDWDDNQKLKSLIQWIEQWESDGVTKIDGIGSQMHISYSMNPDTQASREAHVVKMFELMAATGKLCRITELDMGIDDEEGHAIATKDVTLEQHKLMGEYYKFIIQKYFEIIPEAQQHGITQWAQTDSPSDSGWRADTPIGLWDLNYGRKPTYAGFAEGLSGK